MIYDVLVAIVLLIGATCFVVTGYAARERHNHN